MIKMGIWKIKLVQSKIEPCNGVKLICPNAISIVEREAKKSYQKQPNNIIKQELTIMPTSQHPT
jgi:hypothetical protein